MCDFYQYCRCYFFWRKVQKLPRPGGAGSLHYPQKEQTEADTEGANRRRKKYGAANKEFTPKGSRQKEPPE
jgi:hypothetical protein